MKKFIASAIAEEIYREILYITSHYEEDKIGEKEVKALRDEDYKNLQKSRILKAFFSELVAFNRQDILSFIPYEITSSLDNSEYNEKTVLEIVNKLNPLIDYYNMTMKKYVDDVAYVLDAKMKEGGYIGSFPLYMKIEENMLCLERAVLSTNARAYLSKASKEFGLKITYVDYEIPLKNYSYAETDLREKDIKEIVKYLDSSVKVNLEHAKYYETNLFNLSSSDTVASLNKDELSILLEKKIKTKNSYKTVLWSTMKRSLITMLVLAAVAAIILIIKKYM